MKRVLVFLMIAGLTTMYTFGQQQCTNGRDEKQSNGEIREVQVTGTVTYAKDGKPVPGLTVVAKEKNISRVTDIDGKYALNVSADAILQFSFMGMASQEIVAGNRRIIDVVMEEETLHKTDYSDDYLVPVRGFYDVYDFSSEYYSKVRQILFNGLDDRPEIRFQVMPSFTSESVLDIEFDRKNNKYYIVYHICEQMIYRNQENPDKIRVNKFRTGIDKASVDLIKSLFDIAIAQVRYPEIKKTGEISIMADGTGYYFTLGWDGYPLRSGYTRSPSDGTKMKKLVDTGYELIELAKYERETVKIDEKLQQEIEELIDLLKQ